MADRGIDISPAGVAVADVYASLPLTSLLVVQKGIFLNQQRLWLVLQWLTFCVATADIPAGCAEGHFISFFVEFAFWISFSSTEKWITSSRGFRQLLLHSGIELPDILALACSIIVTKTTWSSTSYVKSIYSRVNTASSTSQAHIRRMRREANQNVAECTTSSHYSAWTVSE
ncbi:hypothetical protein OUZ56_008969 [Daphnia magna]|uniref:Uncharacterized protein n=1 Tax=Daphnia magna TaxID=35525 RepID=A0ABR0AEM0_9CRUS|nr:hypothetical protein OUZ56_008969 [Daphnia magna]